MLLLQFSSGDEERDSMISSLLSEYFATMEEYLQSLQKQGIINDQLNPQSLASALFGMIGFTALRKTFRQEPVYTEETRSTLITMCKGALGLNVIH